MIIYRFIAYILQASLYFLLYPLFVFFLNLKINGAENLKEYKEPYIIAPNHSSGLDSFIILIAFYKKLKRMPIYSVTKDDKLCRQDFGRLSIIYNKYIFRFFAGYPAQSGHNDYKRSLINHIGFIKNGYSVCIFPEGKISEDNSLGEARGGVCFLSQETNVPIIPVAIKGLYKMNFYDFIKRKRKVVVTICSPITIKNDDKMGDHEDALYFKKKSKFILQIIKNLYDSNFNIYIFILFFFFYS
jgi:1-acyl-sn-glycerol-3-phosphate acyltransferase